MLLLFLVLYFSALFVTAWLLVQSYRAPASLWGRRRRLLGVVAILEALYLVQAPACVYLPYVPAKSSVERVVLGADAAGQLYWLEGRSPMAFAWGPRWWFAFGGHLLDGGLEVVPPVRFAKLKDTSWQVRTSAGVARPYPAQSARGPAWAASRRVDSQGRLLELLGTGLYRLAPEDREWRRLTDFGSHQLGWTPEALALLENDDILEVYEVYETARDTRGRRRDLILLERDREGRELRRVPLSMPDESRDTPGARGRTLAVASTAQGLLLFQTWIAETGLGVGRLYRLSATLSDPQVLCSFAFSPWQHLSIAASSDGELFTNGQSILRTSGEKVRDLESPLESCFWLGRVLHGVRRHPFFGAEIQTRQMKFTQYLAAARGTLDVSRRPSDELLQKATAGVELVPWFLGGIDEAGREDEIVIEEPLSEGRTSSAARPERGSLS